MTITERLEAQLEKADPSKKNKTEVHQLVIDVLAEIRRLREEISHHYDALETSYNNGYEVGYEVGYQSGYDSGAWDYSDNY